MIFEYSNHSLEQLKLRSISKKIVILVLSKPDEIIDEEENQKNISKSN